MLKSKYLSWISMFFENEEKTSIAIKKNDK